MIINKFTYFYPEKPTLVSIDHPIFDLMSDNPSWVAEPKYNGSRLELHIMDGRPEFWDRHGKKLAYQPTDEILKEIKRLFPTKGYYVFDGELRHNKVVGVRNKIMIYDVHVYGNELLVRTPFSERRSLLESFLTINTESIGIPIKYKSNFKKVVENDDFDFLPLNTEPIKIPIQYKSNFKKTFHTLIAENEEFEGLVMKNKNGQLDLGRTSDQKSKWMKKVRKKTGRHNF